MSSRDIVYVALFAALVAVLGLIPKIQLAGGVPVTAQSLGIMLAGGILGARRGALALLVFVILVLAGLPLLAGGRGGLSLLAGPSGGFLLGFPIAAWAVGRGVEWGHARLNWWRAFLACVLGGIALLYIMGLPWMTLMADLGWQKALSIGALFVPGDLLKAAVAAMLIVAVNRQYPVIGADNER